MERIHGSYSGTPLEITGSFFCQGPQPIGTKAGVPQWVADHFMNNPEVNTIALSGNSWGVVYSRMEQDIE